MTAMAAEGQAGPVLSEPGCPKHMAFGPCGGVAADGSCEIDARPCPFVARDLVSWPGGAPVRTPHPLGSAAWELQAIAGRRPLVLAEIPVCSLVVDDHRRSAGVLAVGCDAGMTGDVPWARVQLPPVMRSELLTDEGLRAWVVLTCRDRNRAALEGEIAGLMAVGAAGVHCVTGDHPVGGDRPEAQAVFDLDSTRLAALARHSGLLVSVTESPAAPPVALRADRLASKARAGAGWCIVNFVADRFLLADFVARARVLAPSLLFLVSVPVITTPDALERFRRLPGASLPAETIRAIEESGRVTAPVTAAIELAERALDIDGVVGVSLCAPAAPSGPDLVSRDLAATGRALGGGW
jgi:methylenetetrahydrofolate reductase (NADPH)